jgi:hypothetical protein
MPIDLRDHTRTLVRVPWTGFHDLYAFRAGFKVDAVYLLTKIDRWFLQNIKEIVEMEEQLAAAGRLEALV